MNSEEKYIMQSFIVRTKNGMYQCHSLLTKQFTYNNTMLKDV
jgi:hypothetical protein